jgi:hypothetical protein
MYIVRGGSIFYRLQCLYTGTSYVKFGDLELANSNDEKCKLFRYATSFIFTRLKLSPALGGACIPNILETFINTFSNAYTGINFIFGIYTLHEGCDPLSEYFLPECGLHPKAVAAPRHFYHDICARLKSRKLSRMQLLCIAACCGLLNLIQFLINKGHAANKRDCIYERTPLSYAAEFGQEAVVRYLCEQCEVDINKGGGDRFAPLLIAGLNKHWGIVEILLSQRGIDVNSQDGHVGRSILSIPSPNSSLNTPGSLLVKI